MNFISYNNKQLPIRFDYFALKAIMKKFNITNINDLKIEVLVTDILNLSFILQLGLTRGAKASGSEILNYTEEHIDDILSTENMLGDILAIMTYDLTSMYRPSDDLVKRLTPEKKTIASQNHVEMSTSIS